MIHYSVLYLLCKMVRKEYSLPTHKKGGYEKKFDMQKMGRTQKTSINWDKIQSSIYRDRLPYLLSLSND